MKTKHKISGLIILAIIMLSHLQLAMAAPDNNPLTPERYTPNEANPKASYIGVVQALPDADWPILLAKIIKFILGITGSLAVISFTVGGVIMVTAQGQDEKITKGKGILMWSVMALIIIAISYAIVVGVQNLKIIQ